MTPSDVQDAFAYLMFVGMGAVFVGFIANGLAVARLKSRHRTKWQELECPTLGKPAKSSKYFWSGRYEELQDPVLVRLIVPSQIAAIVASLVLVALFVILAFMFWNPPPAPVRQPTGGRVTNNHPLNAVGAVFLGLVVLGLVLRVWALDHVKKQHRAVWQELECPTFWGGGSRFARFMFSRRRRELGDTRLDRLHWGSTAVAACTLVLLAGVISGVLAF